jgi:hypothetical protein
MYDGLASRVKILGGCELYPSSKKGCKSRKKDPVEVCLTCQYVI